MDRYEKAEGETAKYCHSTVRQSYRINIELNRRSRGITLYDTINCSTWGWPRVSNAVIVKSVVSTLQMTTSVTLSHTHWPTGWQQIRNVTFANSNRRPASRNFHGRDFGQTICFAASLCLRALTWKVFVPSGVVFELRAPVSDTCLLYDTKINTITFRKSVDSCRAATDFEPLSGSEQARVSSGSRFSFCLRNPSHDGGKLCNLGDYSSFALYWKHFFC